LPVEVRSALDDPSAAEDRFVALSIGDSGSGMPEDVKERAFEPFFTTKEAGRGTGLGLSTVYGFVKQSKGAVTIDSVQGVGTRVTLYVPRPWQASSPTPPEADTSDVVPAGLRVLLVEDDAEVRAVVRTFLVTLRCTVITAANAEQALTTLDTEGSFDLLLSDIALGPGLRGTQLAAQAQTRFPQMAVLLMSGFSADLLDADRDAPPSWELLRKPCSRAELARAMAKVTAGR
jgi:CheY-like chemotaxis protein